MDIVLVEELQRRMRACLGALNGASLDDDSVIGCFEAVRECFQQLADSAGPAQTPDEGSRERLRTALEELVHLNARLITTAQRDKERLLELLVRAQDARRKVGSSRPAAETGRSCDVRG